jgi:pimeloyl-ACP methyl ester carboxylesterase
VASFVLIPGAGGSAWYWHRVAPLLRAAGHHVLAVELPGDDEQAGLEAYAELVVRSIQEARLPDPADCVLVAQSLGGFTAPLVCARVPVRGLVFVNAMIPLPGETAGAWWQNTDSTRARTQAAERHGYTPEFDLATYFLHDVPEDIARAGEPYQRPQSERIFSDRCQFTDLPEVPIHVLVGADDRFFPSEFQRRIARERLHRDVEELPGGHLIALSQPHALAERLLTCLRSRAGARPDNSRA